MVRDRARTSVTAWLDAALPLADSFDQVDVVELDDLPIPPRLLAWSIELFAVLCDELEQRHPNLTALLAVPLPCTDVLDTGHPDVAAFVASEWPTGPGHAVPGLYVLADEQPLGWERTEEYRRPIDPSPVRSAAYAYYRTRLLTAPASEYERTLYFVHTQR